METITLYTSDLCLADGTWTLGPEVIIEFIKLIPQY